MANRPPFPWLYRGTHEPIEIHRSTGRFLPGGSAHSFTPSHAKVEDTFERIRRQEFPYRPSRQTSTFWGVSHTIAEDYGGPGGFLSRVKAPKEYFLGSQELYGEATLAARTPATERKLLGIPDLEDVARQYWKGVSPQKAKALGRRESHFWEVLMPGEVTVEKQYKIYEDPKGLKYKPFQTKSTPSLVPSVSARPIPEPTLGTIPKSNKSAIPIQSSMKGGRAFFFDIETGGFNKAKSSIFSISFGTHPKDIESFYAQPTKGSFVSRWSERNVWEPIKKLGVKTETEQAILEKFLGKLKNLPEGQVVAGWNIGYVARPGGRGFDIPMLMARAEKYGLAGEYRQAFGKLAIRDIGQEYAYRVAKEVSTYEHLVTQGKLPETLFGQAKGYAELGLKYETGRPATERQAARYLAEEFKYVSGWKQEVAHAVFAKGGYQAHLSAADVASGLGLETTLEKGQLFKGEAGVVKWGRETFYKSLVSQAMKPAGMRKGVQEVPTEKYSRILAEARQMEETGGRAYRGFSKRVITGINEEVTERGGKIGDILAGKGAPEGIGRIVGKAPAARAFGLSGWARKIPGWLWKHKLGVGVSAAVVGAYATQPLSWFSGRDDEYNTIPGLQEGGEAQRMRRILTDFGSGYQGGKEERIVEEIFGELRIALEKYGREVGTGHKRILVPKTVLTQEDIEQTLGFTPVSIAIPEAGQVASTTWRHTKHLYHIHKHEDVWTIHKDRHAASTMTAKAAAIKKGEELDVFSYLTHTLKGLPHVITEGLPGLYYYLRGQLAGVEDMAVRVAKEISSEYVTLLEKLEEKHTNVMSFSQRIFNRIGNAFSGKDDAYNTIEGLQHRGMAGPMRRTLTDFGSGYRGLIKIPEILSKFMPPKAYGFVDIAGKEKFLDLARGAIKEAIKEGLIPAGERRAVARGLVALRREIRASPTNYPVFINTALINAENEAARAAGKSTFSLKEIIKHERFHQMVLEKNLVEDIAKLDPGKLVDLEGFMHVTGRSRSETFNEEAIAFFIGRKRVGKKVGRFLTPEGEKLANQLSSFSGFDNAYNTIEGFRHGGESARMRRLLTDFGSGYRGLGDKWADLMVGMVNRFEFYAKKYPRVFTPRNITVFGTGLGTVTAGLMWYGLYSAFSDEELPPPRFDYVQAEIDYVREHDDLPDAYTKLKWRARAGPKYLEAYQEKIRESNAAIRAQFSGKDDAWNTIEGLQHGGEAERMRRLLTDFGSGSIGAKLLQRAANIFRKGKTGYSLQEIRGLAQSARSQSWQEFARGIGVEVTSNPFVTAQGGVNIGSKRAMKFLGKSFGKETRLMQKQALEEIGLPMGQAYIAEDPILSFSKALTRMGKEAILQVKQMVKAGTLPKETLTSPESIGNIKSLYRTAKELKKSTHATKEALKKTIAFHEATELRNIGALVARKQSKVFGEFLAPQHMMTIPQEEIFLRQLGDRKAYALFKDVRKATDSWFSGFGDKFNTVEGLRHGGIAEDLRHLLTDFGGPWQGILRFFARRKVFTQGKRFLKQQGVRLTAPIKGRGLEFDPGHPGWPSFPPTLYWSKKQAMREAMALGLTRREARAAVPVFFAHEVAEARYAAKLGKGYTTFGSHVSPGVIGEELFAAARLGPKSYKAIKKLRLAEIKRYRSGEERMLPSLEGIQERLARKARTGSVSDFEWQWEQSAYERRYIQGIPKIFKRFEEKHLSKFSGFTEEGIAAIRRESYGFSAGSSFIKFFGIIGQKLGTLGRGVRGRIWGFGKRPVTKAGGLPIPAPVKGEFAISAAELGKMSREQIAARLGGLPRGIKRAKKLAVRRIEEEFAISAAELPGLSHSQIAARLGGIYPAKKIPSGPELVKTVQQRQQNNIQRMLAEQGKPAMPGMIPAPSPAATGIKGFELGDAVIRSKVAGQVTSAGRKARFYKAHTEGKIRASTNAHRPGKRHEDTTGKIVF